MSSGNQPPPHIDPSGGVKTPASRTIFLQTSLSGSCSRPESLRIDPRLWRKRSRRLRHPVGLEPFGPVRQRGPEVRHSLERGRRGRVGGTRSPLPGPDRAPPVIARARIHARRVHSRRSMFAASAAPSCGPPSCLRLVETTFSDRPLHLGPKRICCADAPGARSPPLTL